MTRRLRVQYSGALYHLINRGNYRRDIFESAGAAKSFQATLGQTCEQYAWKVRAYLIELSGDGQEQQRQGFDELSRGWAIGTPAWRQAMARHYSHLALERGFESGEIRAIKEARWRDALNQHLKETRRSTADLATAPKAPPWKIDAAARLRRQFGAPYRWIAEHLKMGSPDAVRVRVARAKGALKLE